MILRVLGQFGRVLPYYPTVLEGGFVAVAVDRGEGMVVRQIGTRKAGGWDMFEFDLGEALASTQLN